MTSPPTEKRLKILVMRYRFIGDTLLAIPFLRNLRAHYPTAEIHVMVAPKSGEVLSHCPYVDRFLFYGKNDFHRYEADADATAGFWQMAWQLRQERYDKVFLLKRSFSSAALAWLAGIPVRVGHTGEGRDCMLTHKTPFLESRHEADNYLDLLNLLAIPIQDRYVEGWVTAREREAVQPYLQSSPDEQSTSFEKPLRILALNTSAHPAKQWPMENFLTLCRFLLAETPATLYFLGDNQDFAMYGEVQHQLAEQLPALNENRLMNLAGKTSLLESMALMESMDLVVGPDSGTLHMAAAMGRPVVALFGPMNEKRWEPLSSARQVVSAPVPCRPCELKYSCPHTYQCMTTLKAESVINACKTLLNL